jgi:hypothetical protein
MWMRPPVVRRNPSWQVALVAAGLFIPVLMRSILWIIALILDGDGLHSQCEHYRCRYVDALLRLCFRHGADLGAQRSLPCGESDIVLRMHRGI